MNKQEWIEELTRERNVTCFFEKKINGKKVKLSYFSMYATEEQKMDKDLNILNFEKTGNALEIPESMIDFDFLKRVFKVKESNSIFKLSYEWKNNIEEKNFLRDVFNILKNRQREYKNDEIMWSFEPGFWSDLTYTKTIREENYYIEIAVIDHLNKSNKKEDTEYLLEIVNKVPYYLKYIKAKYKQLLNEDTILSYARDYGINSLTKDQKNRYMVIKEAFHHQQISYDKLDNKWKTPEILKDLLNNKNIWSIVINSQKFLSINQLSRELLNDKEIIKSCLSNGYNLLELKNNTYSASKWFFDKEMKEIALKTYLDYTIIEDCLDNKEIVLNFLTLLKNKHTKSLYSGNIINEQTKNIEPTLFKDKEIMSEYLSIKCLNEEKHFNNNAIEALKSFSKEDIKDFLNMNQSVYLILKECIKDYIEEDIIELININKDIYRISSEENKTKWDIVLAFIKKNQEIDFCIPKEIRDEIKEMNGITIDEKINQITKNVLNEKLSIQLEKKGHVKRLKI